MSALPNELPSIATRHLFDADAFVFSANFNQPIFQAIEKQGFLQLPETGGYKFAQAPARRLDGVLSHEGGYSQVSGQVNEDGSGATTLATSVIEGLNILEVVTADRIVAQIITEHPNGGNVPSVSFLGTRFDNLRIAGELVEIEPQLDILGDTLDGKESHFSDGGVFARIAHQYSSVKRLMGLPQWASDQFTWNPAEAQRQNVVRCSLVNSIEGAPGKSYGHVIDLPGFGKIFLAELQIIRTPLSAASSPPNPGPRLEKSEAEDYKYRFELTMLRTKQHKSAHGEVHCCYADPNGTGHPTPTPPPDEKKPKPKA
jgi:hypothetical protein